ncbi:MULTISPECIES: class I SAM-dependent methyltransferase [Lysobacter]|uniref:class I SAM-dependent methyltransferase n=1 Tax=Lysobacter TaxID=68 RepID=UPI001F16399E|nr:MULTISPECIES: class I SAM-dependent methyltransferase [Lysobacter]UJB20569.1 class I SAM-dependent methyltransferase [Lysobacter capsici]UJQ30317.1 class I SAM-dependent methyltransferase [Lysobacter gummosus]
MKFRLPSSGLSAAFSRAPKEVTLGGKRARCEAVCAGRGAAMRLRASSAAVERKGGYRARIAPISPLPHSTGKPAMSTASDARFWDRISRKYALEPIADQEAYERTLDRTRGLLKSSDRVLELGCGTGSAALVLAGGVRSYLATDLSAGMIAIAEEKRSAATVASLSFRAATVEELTPAEPFDAVLGFNYLHLVRDLAGTLRRIHGLLAADGVFISKTPCLGDMNRLFGLLLPAARVLGLAPYTGVLRVVDLPALIGAAGFDIVAVERHASAGKDTLPYIAARKR